MGRKKNNKQPNKPAHDESNLSAKELDGVVGGSNSLNNYNYISEKDLLALREKQKKLLFSYVKQKK